MTTAPLPTVRAVLAANAPEAMVVPAFKLRLAPRRWVNTPLRAFSWYSAGVQRSSAVVGSLPVGVVAACSP